MFYEIFSAAGFPFVGAIVNGKSLSTLFKFRGILIEHKTTRIPLLKGINLRIPFRFLEFCFGIILEALFLFLLIPLRTPILHVFFEELKFAPKWNTYVFIACVSSVVALGIPTIIVFIIRSKKINDSDNARKKETVQQERDTINKLISE